MAGIKIKIPKEDRWVGGIYTTADPENLAQTRTVCYGFRPDNPDVHDLKVGGLKAYTVGDKELEFEGKEEDVLSKTINALVNCRELNRGYDTIFMDRFGQEVNDFLEDLREYAKEAIKKIDEDWV